MQDPPVDRLLDRHAIGFLLVGRKMLGHRDDPLGLHSLDLRDRHRACEIGIFAEVLEIASQNRDPSHVDARGFEHVQRKVVGLGADHVAEFAGDRGVEGRRKGNG